MPVCEFSVVELPDNQFEDVDSGARRGDSDNKGMKFATHCRDSRPVFFGCQDKASV